MTDAHAAGQDDRRAAGPGDPRIGESRGVQPYSTRVVVEVSKLARPERMVECLAVVNVPAWTPSRRSGGRRCGSTGRRSPCPQQGANHDSHDGRVTHTAFGGRAGVRRGDCGLRRIRGRTGHRRAARGRAAGAGPAADRPRRRDRPPGGGVEAAPAVRGLQAALPRRVAHLHLPARHRPQAKPLARRARRRQGRGAGLVRRHPPGGLHAAAGRTPPRPAHRPIPYGPLRRAEDRHPPAAGEHAAGCQHPGR